MAGLHGCPVVSYHLGGNKGESQKNLTPVGIASQKSKDFLARYTKIPSIGGYEHWENTFVGHQTNKQDINDS